MFVFLSLNQIPKLKILSHLTVSVKNSTNCSRAGPEKFITHVSIRHLIFDLILFNFVIKVSLL